MNQKVFTWVSVTISLLYLVFGVYIIFFSVIDFTYKKALGGLIIAYGLFRFYRIYRLYLKRKKNDEN